VPGRQGLPQHHADRVEIGAAIDRRAGHLLRRHVARLALEHTDLRVRHPVQDLGNPEIDQLDLAIIGNQDIAGCHVAMHDRDWRIIIIRERMCVVQAAQHL